MTEDVKTYVFQVHMKCMNCVKKLSNALDGLKDKGVKEYDVMFEEQQVQVTARVTLPAEEILDALKSTGKEVTMMSSP